MKPLAPPQSAALERVQGLCGAAARTGRGRVVFLAGDTGSGRSHLLRALAAALPDDPARPRIAFGRISDGRYEPAPRDEKPPWYARLLDTGVVSAGAGLVSPVVGLVGSLVELAPSAIDLLSEIRDGDSRIELSDFLVPLIRATAEADRERPLVCLVDDADAISGGWWSELQFSFAQEMAEELPLVLVLAVDGPASPDAEPVKGESATQALARSLLARGLADWVSLAPLGLDEVRAWLGPAPARLTALAHELTAGRPGDLAELWKSWERRGVVAAEGESPHPPGSRDEKLLMDVDRVATERVASLLGTDHPSRLELARRILACGAMEGQAFTAEVVAAALGYDRDEVIDLLDELVDEEDSGRGLLLEVGYVQIEDLTRRRSHSLWRYRFVKSLEWRVARSRWLRESERRDLAFPLVEALSVLYGPALPKVAHVAAEILQRAGETEGAAHFRRKATAASQVMLETRTRALLAAETDSWSTWDLVDAAEYLVEAGVVLKGRAPAEGLLELSERAAQLALEAGPPGGGTRALSFSLQAHLYILMNRKEQARRSFELGADIAATGMPEIYFSILTGLGELEEPDGDLEAAKANTEKAIDIAVSLRDRRGEAFAMHQLGAIEKLRGQLPAGRELLQGALRLMEEREFEEVTCMIHQQLGGLEADDGNYGVAEEHLTAALSFYRQSGSTLGEAEALRELGHVHLGREEHQEALRLAEASLALHRQNRDEQGIAAGRLLAGMASAGMPDGDRRYARTCLEGARNFYAAIGRGQAVLSAERALDSLEVSR